MSAKLIIIIISIIAVIFLMFFVSFSLFEKKDPFRLTSGKQIFKYIGDSIELEESTEEFSQFGENQEINKKLGIHRKYIILNERDSVAYYYDVFYLKKYNKYFTVYSFYPADSTAFERIHRVKNVVLSVNKNQLNNPSYGAINNPIPVLKYVGKEASIRDNNSDFDKPNMNYLYQQSVEYYSHTLSDQEFNALFGDK